MSNPDYIAQRRAMIATQIRGRGIADERVIASMESVPRHCFVPAEHVEEAYADCPLPIGGGQTISQPYMVACMTALLELQASDRVLEVGSGSGYQSAVLAGLCQEVIAIERNQDLRDRAQACLERLAYQNIQLFCGDGSVGHDALAPYDAILVAAGSPHIPAALPRQLRDGGRLVCPVGNREKQTLLRMIRHGDGLTTTTHTDCIFVPLVGEDAWPAQ